MLSARRWWQLWWQHSLPAVPWHVLPCRAASTEAEWQDRRGSAFAVGCPEFAVSTYGRRAHAACPAGFEVTGDSNGDGKPDYFVSNQEAGEFASSGQTLIYVQKAGTTSKSAFFAGIRKK